ncbi:MAG: 4-(cytidine 5'-diphospho)-2-C-methyl-D-erythritol kinase, partial [Candidatus Zixiibacteriota bacterium]
MNEIILKAPAKINLFLKVLGKRNDGYHNIYSWFQAIDLFDILSFKKIKNPKFILKVKNNSNLSTDENNLIIKTARLMSGLFNFSGGLEICLEKNIPLSAGLAGGSTDSAATIYGINRLFNLKLTNKQMREIGAKIGSDVPFFFSSGQAEVTGRGEVIKARR